jgi:hypothetical protein
MRFLVVLLLVLARHPAFAASSSADGFPSVNIRDCIEDDFQRDQVRITQVDGTDTLHISDTKVRFRPVTVTPNLKYTLSFTGSFTGDVESIEENPRLAVFAKPSRRTPVLPSREIHFLDAAGRRTGHTPFFSMPFRDEHRYVDVFYSPPSAVALRLELASGEGVDFAMQGLSLRATGDEDAINVNPTFQLGSLNYSGWKNISAGGKIIELDGKVVFDTKYGSRGMTFPLPGPGTYALSAKATGNGYNSCVKVDVFDSEEKKIMTNVLRRYEKTNYFVPPPEAVRASLLVYSCLLEEVRLVRVGDENAIKRYSE